MTTPQAEAVTVRPQAVSPSLGWALRRAALGLVLLVSMTTVAAYLANASIDPVSEAAAEGAPTIPAMIAIGTPAAPLLKH